MHRVTVGSFVVAVAVDGFRPMNAIDGLCSHHVRRSVYRHTPQGENWASLVIGYSLSVIQLEKHKADPWPSCDPSRVLVICMC